MQQRSLKKTIYLKLRLRKDLDHASTVHYTTQEEKRQAAPLLLKAPAIVESLGLDLTEFADLPPAGSFRNRHPSIGKHEIVLFMSRLHPKKGLDLLIPAFAAFQSDAYLVIAGPDEGGYEQTVRRLVEQHGLAGRVIFTGMLRGRERIAALADADVFVLPSYQENFGIVVPEALASGTPIVLSDQVNFSEFLVDCPFATVIPCDVGRLATALAEWMNDPTRRADGGEAARTWTLSRFDSKAIAMRWASHYATLTNRP